MKTFRVLILFLGCVTSHGQTEKNIDHQSIFWSRYYNQLTVNEKWSVHSEFDNRLFLKPITQNLFVVRIQGRYKINKNIETGAGVVYFSVATQDPEIHPDFKTPEYRAQQDISLKHDLGKITLSQRFQIEERFIHNANKQELLPGTTFSWRFRYRLQAEYKILEVQNHYLKGIINDEIMFNAGKSITKNTFDQNRIYAALQYGINKNIAFELGYLNSYQRRASGIDFFNRDIIRLSIYHKLKLKNKNSPN
jgi:hypothetical protein